MILGSVNLVVQAKAALENRRAAQEQQLKRTQLQVR